MQLIFIVPDSVDYRRFNPYACNKVCAMLILDADHSFQPNETVVKQCGKNLVILKNTDHRVQAFTKPMFYPAGILG